MKDYYESKSRRSSKVFGRIAYILYNKERKKESEAWRCRKSRVSMHMWGRTPQSPQTPGTASANSALTEVSSGIFSLVHTRARQHLASAISLDIKLLLKCFLVVQDMVISWNLSGPPSPQNRFSARSELSLDEEADQAGQKTDTGLQNWCCTPSCCR